MVGASMYSASRIVIKPIKCEYIHALIRRGGGGGWGSGPPLKITEI